jgi:hypothetical protein
VDPEDEAPRAAAPGWPPPHPSPPLPPPREYGTPGTPLTWRPWLWGLLAGLVVAALVTVGLVVLLPGDSDARDDGGDAGRQPTASTSTSASASSTPPAAPAPYRCWDGSDAQNLKDCSQPKGVEGLRWVFPAMANGACGAPRTQGGAGLVVRVLCLHRLEDGSRVGVGYFQWRSVAAGAAFYEDQGLTRSEVPTPDDKPVQIAYYGVSDDQTKVAALFVHEPFSFTITVPSSATVSPADQQALSPRPADQLRGEPVG